MSFLIPDPGQLRGLASRVTAAADAARTHAERLGLAVAAAGWHGPAARVFAGQADLALGGLRTSAGRLEDAAAALRRHADRVDELLHVALLLVRAGLGPLPELLAHADDLLRPMTVELGGAIGAAATVAGDAVSTAGSAVSTVGSAVSTAGGAVADVAGDVAGSALDCLGLG